MSMPSSADRPSAASCPKEHLLALGAASTCTWTPQPGMCLTNHLSSCWAPQARKSCGVVEHAMLLHTHHNRHACPAGLSCCAAGMLSCKARSRRARQRCSMCPGVSNTSNIISNISSRHEAQWRGAVGLPYALPAPAGFLSPPRPALAASAAPSAPAWLAVLRPDCSAAQSKDNVVII